MQLSAAKAVAGALVRETLNMAKTPAQRGALGRRKKAAGQKAAATKRRRATEQRATAARKQKEPAGEAAGEKAATPRK